MKDFIDWDGRPDNVCQVCGYGIICVCAVQKKHIAKPIEPQKLRPVAITK